MNYFEPDDCFASTGLAGGFLGKEPKEKTPKPPRPTKEDKENAEAEAFNQKMFALLTKYSDLYMPEIIPYLNDENAVVEIVDKKLGRPGKESSWELVSLTRSMSSWTPEQKAIYKRLSAFNDEFMKLGMSMPSKAKKASGGELSSFLSRLATTGAGKDMSPYSIGYGFAHTYMLYGTLIDQGKKMATAKLDNSMQPMREITSQISKAANQAAKYIKSVMKVKPAKTEPATVHTQDYSALLNEPVLQPLTFPSLSPYESASDSGVTGSLVRTVSVEPETYMETGSPIVTPEPPLPVEPEMFTEPGTPLVTPERTQPPAPEISFPIAGMDGLGDLGTAKSVAAAAAFLFVAHMLGKR